MCLFGCYAPDVEDQKSKEQDFLDIITRVEAIIWDQKFTGAAASILNGNIIARELPLGGKEAEEPEAPERPRPSTQDMAKAIIELMASTKVKKQGGGGGGRGVSLSVNWIGTIAVFACRSF